MKSLQVKTPFGTKPIEVSIGNSWSVLGGTLSKLNDRHVQVIVDNRVTAYHGEALREELSILENKNETIVIASELAKEASNAIPLLEEIGGFLPASKRSALIAVGGGTILNMGGFFASIISRGIEFYAVPTTPMAIADVAFGSKQALNTKHQKNYIGTYYDPTEIIINTQALSSIDTLRLKLNCIESLKQFIATDRDRVELMADFFRNERTEPETILNDFLLPSALQKINIINEDPREENIGRILMIGHQIAHPLEAATHYRIGHDLAVAIGIYVELQELTKRGILNKDDFETYSSMMGALDIELRHIDFNQEEFKALMLRNKLLSPERLPLLLNIPRFGEVDRSNLLLEWTIGEAIEATQSALNER